MKYIDADRLKAEIRKLRGEKPFCDDSSLLAYLHGLSKIEDFVDSLQQEQPEVDIEKEYTEFVVSDPVYSKLVNDIVGKSIARHFYELGLNAKEDKQ